MFNPLVPLDKEKEIYELTFEQIMNKSLISIHIADVHFGVIDPKTQYYILKEQFIYKIQYINFDILSIDGDLFDHKFMTNSDAVMYASMFINDLVNICRLKGATLIIIHGTLSHDANQLKIFYHYLQDTTVDVRIVEEVKFEYIKGCKILCIPELYGREQEYYDNFLFYSGVYDSVYMHGTVKGSVFGATKTDKTEKSPVFDINDFKLCKGPIISGHVHTGGVFSSHIYYTGSPIYDRFGEEADKGFLVVLHNLNTSEYYVHLETIKSFRYVTINLDSMLQEDPKKIIEYVSNLRDTQGIDYLRIEFDLEFDDIQNSNFELLKNYYRTDQSIKFKHESNKNKAVIQANQDMLDKYKDYDYILDKELSEYDILCRYINQKKQCKYLTTEELIEIIQEEI